MPAITQGNVAAAGDRHIAYLQGGNGDRRANSRDRFEEKQTADSKTVQRGFHGLRRRGRHASDVAVKAYQRTRVSSILKRAGAALAAERAAGVLRSRSYFEGGGGIMRVSASDGSVSGRLSRCAFAAQAGIWLLATDDLLLDVALQAFYKPGWTDNDDEARGTSFGLQVCLICLGR